MQVQLSAVELKILRNLVDREFVAYGSDSPVLYNLLQKLSPVPAVPNNGIGESSFSCESEK